MKMIDTNDLLSKVQMTESAVSKGIVTKKEAAFLRNLYVQKVAAPVVVELIGRYVTPAAQEGASVKRG
jgi:5'(3')-deoxyribonucleotidase